MPSHQGISVVDSAGNSSRRGNRVVIEGAVELQQALRALEGETGGTNNSPVASTFRREVERAGSIAQNAYVKAVRAEAPRGSYNNRKQFNARKVYRGPNAGRRQNRGELANAVRRRSSRISTRIDGRRVTSQRLEVLVGGGKGWYAKAVVKGHAQARGNDDVDETWTGQVQGRTWIAPNPFVWRARDKISGQVDAEYSAAIRRFTADFNRRFGVLPSEFLTQSGTGGGFSR